MKVATLGPQGTCSEEAAAAFLAELEASERESLVLCDTFQEAVELVLKGEVAAIVIPAAYVNYNRLTFENIDRLRVREIIYTQPTFVLAAREDFVLSHTERPRKVACHRSPSPLLGRLEFPFEQIEAASNSAAALMVSNGECDLAVTNITSLEHVNCIAPPGKTLRAERWYGSIDMIWAVFEKGSSSDRKRPIWVSSFSKDENRLPDETKFSLSSSG